MKEHQGTLKLSQEKYFQTMTKTYDLVEAKSTKLPVLPTIKLYDENRFELKDKKLFQGLVRSLLYANM